MQESILFQLNIPAELTIQNTTKYYVFVSAFKTGGGITMIEFLNLSTHLVVSVTDWGQIFKIAKDRAEAQLRHSNGEAKSDDLFLALGEALNPVLNRQNIEECN